MNLPEQVAEFLRDNPPHAGIYHPKLETTIAYTSARRKDTAYVVPKNGRLAPIDNRDGLFDLGKATMIAVNGWNWIDKQSEFVGFDIDLLSDDHKQGFGGEKMAESIALFAKLSYTRIGRSKSGKGVHVVVMLDNPTAENRKEHYATRDRTKLKLSADLGVNIDEHRDKGQTGNLWIWSDKTGEGAFEVIKQAESVLAFADLPEIAKKKPSTPRLIYDEFDIEASFFAKHGLGFEREQDGESIRYRTQPRCPFHDGTDGQWAIWVHPSGRINAKCFHTKCEPLGWQEFWSHYEGATTAPGSVGRTDDDPARLGQLIRNQLGVSGQDTVCQYDETIYRYRGNIWQPDETGDFNAEILKRCDYQLASDARKAGKPTRHTTRELVANVKNHILAAVPRLNRTTNPAPFRFSEPGQHKKYLMGFHNGVLDVAKYARAMTTEGQGDFFGPPSPDFFTTEYPAFDFDPHAPRPDLWLRTLAENVPCELSRHTLQEFTGLGLTWDTSRQAILVLQGVGGSGKSLVSSTVKGLHGPRMVKTLDIDSVSQSNFWGQHLIGCRHVHLTEFHGAVRNPEKIVRILKSISGEDDQDLDRKNLTHFNGPLPALVTLILNGELDNLPDASGALLSRLHYVEFPHCRRGTVQEDHKLREKLLPELPGILNWAIEGLARLLHSSITVNPSTVALRKRFQVTNAPVAAWFDETIIKTTGEIPRRDMYTSFVAWCEEIELKPLSAIRFWQEIRTAHPDLRHLDIEGLGPNKRVRCCRGVAFTRRFELAA